MLNLEGAVLGTKLTHTGVVCSIRHASMGQGYSEAGSRGVPLPPPEIPAGFLKGCCWCRRRSRQGRGGCRRITRTRWFFWGRCGID